MDFLKISKSSDWQKEMSTGIISPSTILHSSLLMEQGHKKEPVCPQTTAGLGFGWTLHCLPCHSFGVPQISEEHKSRELSEAIWKTFVAYVGWAPRETEVSWIFIN